ncbi:MAG: peptidoglycan-binding protein [Oscillatoriaceae bacterium SKW80]|nr:peptidoglycan-binding protein [Oscillatoriaceae bacterium SKYG93]MCX8121186.1 peptidoglycan-binding protein [Oscillatoriaceae bacterium SKW80]MDW8453484.1 peptidoglycan-binding protein [Oscillatoriaceae cyanobacterium SKYGB_i_bin93]HIK26834.1 peptidoglycan-binding protein [Oscillatoriaceae cyanobacterium M7585_C2015_266]
MEALAYAHLVTVYEKSVKQENPVFRKNWISESKEGCYWKNLFRRVSSPTLSLLAVSLSWFGMADSSIAALQRGDNGQEVTHLQHLLMKSGYYNGPITGYFGELTEEAVKRAQQAQGQSVDGIADERLISSLQNSGNNTTQVQLARGDSGEAIIDLQNNLKAAGYYDGPVTGFFGSLTEAAVMAFQQAKGLSVNGIVDEKILSLLNEEIKAMSSVSPVVSASATETAFPVDNLFFGCSGDAVLELQKRLQAVGYYDGILSGDFDIDTEAAVIRFQRDQGIKVDGIVGPITRDRLMALR